MSEESPINSYVFGPSSDFDFIDVVNHIDVGINGEMTKKGLGHKDKYFDAHQDQLRTGYKDQFDSSVYYNKKDVYEHEDNFVGDSCVCYMVGQETLHMIYNFVLDSGLGNDIQGSDMDHVVEKLARIADEGMRSLRDNIIKSITTPERVLVEKKKKRVISLALSDVKLELGTAYEHIQYRRFKSAYGDHAVLLSVNTTFDVKQHLIPK